MADSLTYVYGVVRADFPLSHAPDGVDDAPLRLLAHGDLAALVSVVPRDAYAPEALERVAGDVEWLGPRALAHDRVLSWASDRAATVPLPMFSLFSGADAVLAMLRDRASTLAAALVRATSGREYSLRMYRVDAELREALGALSPRIAELAAQAAAAAPGARYLLERKLETERNAEVRAVASRVAGEAFAALAAHSLDAVRTPIPREPGDASRGTMVLNGAFLVAPDALEGFRRALTAIVEERTAQGFRFDFTGPWPIYHFAEPRDG